MDHVAFGVYLLTRFQYDPPTEEQTVEQYTAETLEIVKELYTGFKADHHKPETATGNCQGTTKKGQPCKRKGTANGFCKVHQPVPVPVEVPEVTETIEIASSELEPEAEADAEVEADPEVVSEPEAEPAPVTVVAVTCKGRGRKGPCKSKALKGQEYCRRHIPAEPEADTEPEPEAEAELDYEPAQTSVWTQCEYKDCKSEAEQESEFCKTHSKPPAKSRTVMPDITYFADEEESEEDILESILREF